MSALFGVRKARFGNKTVLQKFDQGPNGKVGFFDVPYDDKIGAFTIVPRETLQALQKRVADADRRAAAQRKSRADKRDFEASRMHDE